jgi:ribosome-binding factor A
MGDSEEESNASAGLEHARGYLRTQLAARVQLRFVPELTFKLDQSAAYASRIEELLSQVAESSESDVGHEST